MRETVKILNLATALAAVAAPAATPPAADTAEAPRADISAEMEDGIQPSPEISLPGELELMSFTVQQTSDGVIFPQHSSHSSHASHASHMSGGIPGGWPDSPDPPNLPSLPDGPSATYPPQSVPPTAPVASTDPAYLACTRASSGLGVNQIASELEQLGVPDAQAVNIAKQALAAVLDGGHFCDPYLGTSGQ